MTTLYNPAFAAGTKVTGKWHGRQYVVEQVIGAGANGKVFLVSRGRVLYAMKMGFDSVDLQMEVNSLTELDHKAPMEQKFLVDADNFYLNGKDYPFYVMKYIRGQSLMRFVQQNGPQSLPLIGRNLLRRLSLLHDRGWIFGDLKPEHIMVTSYGEVELVDFGGLTPIGRSVRQFTEMYDRGFWNAGSRVAEPCYDLFAFAILFLQYADAGKSMLTASQLLPQNRNRDYIMDWIQRSPLSRQMAPALKKAAMGQYQSSREALEHWTQLAGPGQVKIDSSSDSNWLGGAFAASLVLLGATVYFVWY